MGVRVAEGEFGEEGGEFEEDLVEPVELWGGGIGGWVRGSVVMSW